LEQDFARGQELAAISSTPKACGLRFHHLSDARKSFVSYDLIQEHHEHGSTGLPSQKGIAGFARWQNTPYSLATAPLLGRGAGHFWRAK
jgi:hypothetical protein